MRGVGYITLIIDRDIIRLRLMYRALGVRQRVRIRVTVRIVIRNEASPGPGLIINCPRPTHPCSNRNVNHMLTNVKRFACECEHFLSLVHICMLWFTFAWLGLKCAV